MLMSLAALPRFAVFSLGGLTSVAVVAVARSVPPSSTMSSGSTTETSTHTSTALPPTGKVPGTGVAPGTAVAGAGVNVSTAGGTAEGPDGDNLPLDVVAKVLFDVGMALATHAESDGPVHVSVTLGKRGFARVSLDRDRESRTVYHC